MDIEPIVETNCVHKVSNSWSDISELNYYARKMGFQGLDKYCRIIELNNVDEIRITNKGVITVIQKGDIIFQGTLDKLAGEENGDAIRSFQIFLRNMLFSCKVAQNNYNLKKWSKYKKK
jgi:hypothetical protein